MADVLLEFEDRYRGIDDRYYTARVCGREREDGMWEGWIEFVAADNSVRTGRETTQPNLDLLRYWASGLTAGYLDGALLRALRPAPVPPATSHATPMFDGPAPEAAGSAVSDVYAPRAVLDPFAVYAEGDQVLHGQLEALSEGQLRTIIRAYGLAAGPIQELDGMNRLQLAHYILSAVRDRATR